MLRGSSVPVYVVYIVVELVYSVCMTVNFMDPQKALEITAFEYYVLSKLLSFVQLCTIYMMEKHLIGTQVYCCRV
jgi:hypothetical protein